jgi:hypothetical protein
MGLDAQRQLLLAERRYRGMNAASASEPDVAKGRRNYGDHDKGLAPLSLCESR